MNILYESLNRYFDNLNGKIEEEIFLDEGKRLYFWYEITVNGNTYYAKVKDREDLKALYKKGVARNNNNDILDDKIYRQWKKDIIQAGNFGKVKMKLIDDSEIPDHGNIITLGIRSDRGQKDKYLDSSIKNLMSEQGYDTKNILIHHIDKHEFNQKSDNLIALPYSENKNNVKIGHKILDSLEYNDIIKGTIIKQPYFIQTPSGAARYDITIVIKKQ